MNLKQVLGYYTEELWLLMSAPLQLRLVLAVTEVESGSVTVSILHPLPFICGSSGAGQMSSQRGISPQTLFSAGVRKH